ncbi:MAG: alkaline phosphatase family protein [Gracilibacteraceae bacterium]|jgi:predicted AlkP superfamily phosphohydrolase/phosphomutase|nr:alkaline phosphatase family protein [Gracilibacteraceae bacterium]
MRKAASEKILVLGIDGLDPSLTRKYVRAGLMPNVKKFLERGSASADLVMLGGQPTITPPMWTTLATGTYPCTHGITDFWVADGNNLDTIAYGLDSRLCKAEQLWNVFAESGKKTLVWHWPGSSWPPTSSSPNLSVVDGTQPEGVNCGVGEIEKDFILVADVKTEDVYFREKAAADSRVPCVISDLAVEETLADASRIAGSIAVGAAATRNLILSPDDGQGTMGKMPFDVALSPIKPAAGWTDAPEDAMEFTMLLSHGLIHRSALLVRGESGKYDTVLLYKRKKSEKPFAVLREGVFTCGIVDEGYRNDVKYEVTRSMRLLSVSDDGSHLKIWVSTAMDINENSLWHPQELQRIVKDNCGPALPGAILGGYDQQLMQECMIPQWRAMGEWQAKSLNYLIDHENFEIVFSHFHNVDLQGHMIIKFLKDKGEGSLPEHVYAECMEMVYRQTDEYIGKFMHYLDKGWTVFIISDHAAVCPEHGPVAIGEPVGVNVRLMEELGYTALKKDAQGNELRELDWEKTRAVAVRGNFIYINLKGRNPHGTVDPAEQYELEEQIMTDLYGYKHPETGKRVISLAVRNKDAILLGLGGPDCGDIVYWTAEGYNFDHGDSLSTTRGYADTSVSPIFMAAGNGVKSGYSTDRIIRQVDFVPTMAVIGGVRMPKQCEGAPVYQILSEEY